MKIHRIYRSIFDSPPERIGLASSNGETPTVGWGKRGGFIKATAPQTQADSLIARLRSAIPLGLLFLLLPLITILPSLAFAAMTPPTVKEIRIEGQDKLSAEAIRYRIGHPVGAPLNLRRVSEDIKTLYGLGYFESIEAFVDPGLEAPEVSLVFRVREKPSIRKISVEGYSELTEEKIREAMKLREREIFSESKKVQTIQAIKKLYAEEGYFLTKVAVESQQAANNQVNLTIHIEEGPEIRISRIRFVGNDVFDDEALVKMLGGFQGSTEAGPLSAITSSGKYDEAVLERDVAILKQEYLKHGYKDVKIEPPDVELSPDKETLQVIFFIEEGEQYFVKGIHLEGEVIFDPKEMLRYIALKPKAVFNQQNLVEDINRLTDMYSNKGFAFANVDPQMVYDKEARSVEITFRISRGELIYFDKFHISGNVKTYDRVIRRILSVQEGQLFNGVKLNESRNRVQSLGFFKEVNFLTEPNEDRTGMDVKILVEEGPTGSLNLGVGYSSVDRLIGNAQVSQGNLFGTGQTLRLSGEMGARRKRFNIYYNEPYLFDSFWSFSTRLFSEERILPNFTRQSIGGAISFGRRITFSTSVSLSYSYQETTTSMDGSSGSFIGSADDKIGSIAGLLARNTKDHPYDPTRGTDTGLTVELAHPVFAGDTEYVKVNAYARAFYNPVWKIVISGGADISYGTTLDGTELPFSQRYLTGGINSVRGYEYGSLGPRREIPTSLEPDFETNGREAGGNKEMLFNFELLFPIIEEVGIKGVLFYDMGNVFSEKQPYELSKLRHGFGYGIRWFSPLGPLRFEWGFPIDRLDGERASVFEFTIGAFF